VLNKARRHEGILGSGGIAPCILDLGTRWRWVVSFMPRLLSPQGRAPGTYWIGDWVGPRVVLDMMVKREITSPCWELNPRIPIIQPIAQCYTNWAITALRLNINVNLIAWIGNMKIVCLSAMYVLMSHMYKARVKKLGPKKWKSKFN
jgi:hypothetical protein